MEQPAKLYRQDDVLSGSVYSGGVGNKHLKVGGGAGFEGHFSIEKGTQKNFPDIP
jgi:hypothetical protein